LTRKTVAIRGLDTGLYNEVFSMAKKDGKRVSDVVNSALKAFINGDLEEQNGVKSQPENVATGSVILTIEDEGEASLSKNDILNISKDMGPFRIESSGDLIFEKDVDEVALRGIEKIVINSGSVSVPRKSYAQFLIKCQIKGKLEKY
jgi:CRISPR/Cas system CSM-associated protein Csm4 (group 5 of RAMP superfamily)